MESKMFTIGIKKSFRLDCILFAAFIILPLMANCSSTRNNGRRMNLENNSTIDNAITRQQRFLNLFFIVRFPNSQCNASNGMIGTCFTAVQCTQRGGSASGSCANNYGVCCLFILSSTGNTSSQNNTIFQNAGFPSTTTAAQTTTVFISKTSSDICQFKLDFLTFDVTRPVLGDCNTVDRFTVTGQNRQSITPALCGLNTGQMIFADVSQSQGPIMLSMTTVGNNPRSWNIRVTQIACSDVNRAPSNCLQYVTGATGAIKSFNYDVVAPIPSTGYINNLNYAICIRKEAGFCNIRFTNAMGTTFGIESTGPALTEAGTGLTECPNDFILIAATRLCANRLNADPAAANPTVDAPVTDTTNGPFVVQFVSNNAINGRGFMLDYQQLPCV